MSSKFIPDIFSACFFAAAVFFCTFIFSPFPSSASDITPSKVIELANSDRSGSGLGALRENSKLDRSAMDKAEDMAKNNYFSHTSPEGLTPWHWIEKENYDYAYAGENLAMDFVSAEKMNEAWLASPTHRANILNEKYKDIGVAVKEGVIDGHSTIIVVQQFGSGDKNGKDEEEVETNNNKSVLKTGEPSYPVLPPETKNTERNKILSFNPIITSPKQNEMISNESVEVVGRSVPNAKIFLRDGEKEISQIFSDENGWFRGEVTALSEGRHELRVESEEQIGSAKKTKESLSAVEFSIDRSELEANYRVYARKDVSGNEEYFLRVTSNKPNCIFDVGGQTRSVMNGKSAFFAISKNKLSSVIRIKDQAGNRKTKHIVLANFYQGSGQGDLVDKAAQIFFEDKVFASDSGRNTIMKNLGLAMANNN